MHRATSILPFFSPQCTHHASTLYPLPLITIPPCPLPSAFIGLAAISITSAKPSLIIGLLEAIEAAAAMRRVHPHALSGGCRRSPAESFGIIATVRDDAGASSSMPREEASVQHSQLAFWCRYVGGEPAHRAMEASEGRLTASPVLHRPWPAAIPPLDHQPLLL